MLLGLVALVDPQSHQQLFFANPCPCSSFTADVLLLTILGFVPKERARFGQRYTVQATEALAEFEKMDTKGKAALNQLIKLGALQNGKWDPKNLEDKEVFVISNFKLA